MKKSILTFIVINVLLTSSYCQVPTYPDIYYSLDLNSTVVTSESQVENTGAHVVYFELSETASYFDLRAFCWDGLDPSFAIELNGTILIQSLNGNNFGYVSDPDIVIDPRPFTERRIMITYTVDGDDDLNNGSPLEVHFEVWETDGLSLSIVQGSTVVPSSTNQNSQPNIDISSHGQVAIVYQNGFNSCAVAFDDILNTSNGVNNNNHSLIDLPCIMQCSSWSPDVSLIHDPNSGITHAAFTFIYGESAMNPPPPHTVAQHSLDFGLIGLNVNPPCGSYYDLWETQGYIGMQYVGTPRISSPHKTGGNVSLNDFHVVFECEEFWDNTFDRTHVFAYTRENNGPVQFQNISSNYPTDWTTSYTSPQISCSFSSSFDYYNPCLYPDPTPFIDFFDVARCNHIRPVSAYFGSNYCDAWSMRSFSFTSGLSAKQFYPTGHPNAGSPIPWPKNPYISINEQIIARRSEKSGIVATPKLSVVSDMDPDKGDYRAISAAARFSGMEEVTYFYYARGAGQLIFEKHPFQNTVLKKDFSNFATISVNKSTYSIDVQQFTLNSDYNGEETIQVIDINGRVLLEKIILLNVGQNFIKFNELERGFYLLSCSNKSFNLKFMVI